MNRRHQRSSPDGASRGAAREKKPSAKGGLGKGDRRRWLMRLLAATLVPLFLIGLLEVGLRVIGYGYSTRYFLPSRVHGQQYLIPNHKFTYRFFPPALARTALHFRIPSEKPPETYRIFVFGESAAWGDPDPAYGVGRQLEVLLQERYPGADFQVICTAMTAINSHAILPIARECARLDGDLWIIYMGNNEMVGAYGAGTVFSSKAPRLGMVRAILALKSTRVGQLLDAVIRGLQTRSPAPEAWGGIEMFSENQLRHDNPGRLRAYENFQGNLEDVLRIGQQAGVPILLSTVGSNLRDCAPFASLHAESLAPTQLVEWERFFEQGKRLEATGAYPVALTLYSNAAAIDSDYAELHYRLGRCHLALTNPVRARDAFERARDHDVLAVRADTRINEIIRNAGGRRSDGGVHVVDATESLAEYSPDGIPGRELFFEHVHFTLRGNYQLARLFAEEVSGLLPSWITETDREDWRDADVCKRHLAATLWDQHRVWNAMLDRLSKPPHTGQVGHLQNLDHCRAQKDHIISLIGEDTPQEDRDLYVSAIARAPEDNLLHTRFAQYLEAMGFRSEAIAECQRVCELLPDFEWPHYTLGELYVRAGRYGEAAASFRRALEIRGDFTQAREALERIKFLTP